jgi:hypothetical protein
MVVPRSRKRDDDRLSLSLRKRPRVQRAERFAGSLQLCDFVAHSRRDRHRNVATSSIGLAKRVSFETGAMAVPAAVIRLARRLRVGAFRRAR